MSCTCKTSVYNIYYYRGEMILSSISKFNWKRLDIPLPERPVLKNMLNCIKYIYYSIL